MTPQEIEQAAEEEIVSLSLNGWHLLLAVVIANIVGVLTGF